MEALFNSDDCRGEGGGGGGINFPNLNILQTPTAVFQTLAEMSDSKVASTQLAGLSSSLDTRPTVISLTPKSTDTERFNVIRKVYAPVPPSPATAVIALDVSLDAVRKLIDVEGGDWLSIHAQTPMSIDEMKECGGTVPIQSAYRTIRHARVRQDYRVAGKTINELTVSGFSTAKAADDFLASLTETIID